MGKSLVEDDKVDLAKELLARSGGKILLPSDHVVVAELKEGAPFEVVANVPDGKMGVDIGPATVDAYSAVIAKAKTIIWNGPMGVFEKPPFDRGTVALAKAVAASGAVSVVGGGDSEKAIKSAGVRTRFRTFLPAAARRWSFWRGSSYRALRRCRRSKSLNDHRREIAFLGWQAHPNISNPALDHPVSLHRQRVVICSWATHRAEAFRVRRRSKLDKAVRLDDQFVLRVRTELVVLRRQSRPSR